MSIYFDLFKIISWLETWGYVCNFVMQTVGGYIVQILQISLKNDEILTIDYILFSTNDITFDWSAVQLIEL